MGKDASQVIKTRFINQVEEQQQLVDASRCKIVAQLPAKQNEFLSEDEDD